MSAVGAGGTGYDLVVIAGYCSEFAPITMMP
jgi:hypothetical protein